MANKTIYIYLGFRFKSLQIFLFEKISYFKIIQKYETLMSNKHSTYRILENELVAKAGTMNVWFGAQFFMNGRKKNLSWLANLQKLF